MTLKKPLLLLLCLVFFGPAFLWAKDSYIIHRTYFLPRGIVFDGAISNDSRYAVAIDKNYTLRLWRFGSGTALKVIRTGSHKAVTALFHPTKPLLFTGGMDNTVQIWDVNKGVKVQSLTGHTGEVKTLAISADGAYLVSGGRDSQIIIWRLDRFRVHKKVIESSQKVVSLDLHPDNDTLAWANGRGEVKAWSLSRSLSLGTHKEHTKGVLQVKFHPKGTLLGSVAHDGKVVLWSWKDDKVHYGTQAHTQSATGVSFNPDGRSFITCSVDGTIKIWSMKDKSKPESELKLVEKPVHGCAFSQDGKAIYGVFSKNYTRSWLLGEDGFLRELQGHKKNLVSLDISKKGRHMVSASIDNEVIIWDMTSMTKKSQFELDARIQRVRFANQSSFFATAGADSEIKIWETETGKLVQTLKGHKGKVNALDFHPTLNYLLSGGADKRVVLWDLSKGTILYQKEVHKGQVNQVRFSPDGETYATASTDNSAKIFRLADHQQLANLEGHTRGVRDLAFTGAGDLLATGADDKEIRLWDAKSGQLRQVLQGHEFIVSGVGFSPDGKTLVSVSRDKTMRLWDVDSGKFIRTLSGSKEQISDLAITPDGEIAAIATFGRRIELIRLPADYFGKKRKAFVKLELETPGLAPPEPPKDEVKITEEPGLLSSEPDLDLPAIKKDPGQTEKDVQEEKEIITRDNVFEAEPEKVDEELVALRQGLNGLLKEKQTCKNAQEILFSATGVLKKDPVDMVAYYALIQVFLVQQDLQMIFLSSRLGERAIFQSQVYDFASELVVNNHFRLWNDTLFNRSVMEGQNTVTLEFVDCKNEVVSMSMPRFLLYLEIPRETLETMVNNRVQIAFNAFANLGQQPQLFRNRLFGLIDAVDGGETRLDLTVLNKYAAEGSRGVFGFLRADLTRVQQWGLQSDRILFELKRGQENWKSYFSDTDKTKTMLLRGGNYYMKVNNRVRKAFEISDNDQRVEITVD